MGSRNQRTTTMAMFVGGPWCGEQHPVKYHHKRVDTGIPTEVQPEGLHPFWESTQCRGSTHTYTKDYRGRFGKYPVFLYD